MSAFLIGLIAFVVGFGIGSGIMWIYRKAIAEDLAAAKATVLQLELALKGKK